MIDLRHVQTFLTIEQHGSFSAAAEALDIAQPTVSLHIKSLERKLGYDLFDRVGKYVVMNGGGIAFLPIAKEMIRLANEASTRPFTSSLSGSLNLCVVQSVCTYLIPSLLKAFQEKYPQVNIKITVNRPNVYMLEQLRDAQFDASIVLETPFDIPALVSEPLWSSHLIVVASPDHHLASRPLIELTDLADEGFVLPEEGAHYRKLFLRRLAEAGIAPNIAVEIDSLAAIKELVVSGLGLAALPAYAAVDEIASGTLAALPINGPEMSLTARLIWYKNRPLSPQARAFINLLTR